MQVVVNFLTHERVLTYLDDAKTVIDFNFNLNHKSNEPMRTPMIEAAKTLASKGKREEYWILIPRFILPFFSEGYFQPNEVEDSSEIYHVGMWYGRWNVYCDRQLEQLKILVGSGYESESPLNFARINIDNFYSNLYSDEPDLNLDWDDTNFWDTSNFWDENTDGVNNAV